MLIGAYRGELHHVGLAIEVRRHDGKGRTVLEVSGPDAALSQRVIDAVWRWIVEEAVDGRYVRYAEYMGVFAIMDKRRGQCVAAPADAPPARAEVAVTPHRIVLGGRRRQTVAAIERALDHYAFLVAGRWCR